jgi:hypothetical protein
MAGQQGQARLQNGESQDEKEQKTERLRPRHQRKEAAVIAPTDKDACQNLEKAKRNHARPNGDNDCGKRSDDCALKILNGGTT